MQQCTSVTEDFRNMDVLYPSSGGQQDFLLREVFSWAAGHLEYDLSDYKNLDQS